MRAQVLPHGDAFVDCDATSNSVEILDDSLADSTPNTPIFFILSPGADVVGDVDKLAAKYGFVKGVTYHNVSMGQGQDVVAMQRLELGQKQGHWVILNNVHLMPRWCVELEKAMDEFARQGSHEKFRVFMTSEMSSAIPIGLLARSIKLNNEPPAGLKANLKACARVRSVRELGGGGSCDASVRAARVHVLLARVHRRGGAQDSLDPLRSLPLPRDHDRAQEVRLEGVQQCGARARGAVARVTWGRAPALRAVMYPFSLGDLRDSAVCLQNYMENAPGRIPWEDLRYIFGEIIYGGHIVNDFDRLMCVT